MMDLTGICLSCFSRVGNLNPCPHCGADRTRLLVSPQHLKPGTVLNQNYIIGKALGQGGFGITYLGFEVSAKRIVAIKEYFPNGHVSRQANGTNVIPVDQKAESFLTKGVNLFFKEALVLANFSSHPNIVNVYHFFRENNTAYIVMEYVNGKSLKDYLQARGGSISFAETEQILCPIMSALDDLHQAGLLHRDISPDNIYLTADGHSKLLDFGAARFSLGDETQNAASIIKPGYAPLEQYSSTTDQGSWTDVYAMGATFYKCLTGQLPISASERAIGKTLPSPKELGANIPDTVDQAIMRAMNMKPEFRFGSIAEFERIIREASVISVPQQSVTSVYTQSVPNNAHPSFVQQPIQQPLPQPSVPQQPLPQPVIPQTPPAPVPVPQILPEEPEPKKRISKLLEVFIIILIIFLLLFFYWLFFVYK